jgi:hypothetical protein
MNVIKFIRKNSSQYTLHTGYEETINTKFVGVQVDNHKN